jgi:hypothetical protein
MDVENLLPIYQEALMAGTTQITCTGLSLLTDNAISHDKFTRLLSSGQINEKHVWQQAKVLCHELRDREAVFIVDDSIQAKPYTDESELNCWHYDHVSGKNVKGVCFLTGLYYGDGVSVPAGVEFVTKPVKTVNKKGKRVRKAKVSKNTLFRNIVGHGLNNLDFKYVLADSWFGNSENMKFVKQKDGLFVFALKSNRKAALSLEDKQNGRYTNIRSMGLEGRSQVVYFEQLDFPVAITCQVFKNGDDTAALYLASNDLDLDSGQMAIIYQKRWKVEEYHKSIKSNTCFAKSPTRTVTTQKSHFLASIGAFSRFELLKMRKDKNHFALKCYINIMAMRQASSEVRKLLTPNVGKVA